MHRSSPIEQLSERVRNVDAAVREKLALLRRRWGADVQLEDARARIADLEIRVAKERGDVDKLRGGGLRLALMKLFGMLDRRIEREERELFEISLEYQAAFEQLGDAERVRLDVTERLLALGDAELHAETAINALRRFLDDNPAAAASLDPAMAARIEVPIEQFARLASIEPAQAWAEAMATLRASNTPDTDGDGPVWPSLSRGQAIAAVNTVRGKLTTTVFGEKLGASETEVLSPHQEVELGDALQAAAGAHEALTALREALDKPLRREQTHFERADAVAGEVIAAQTALARFVREVSDVYLLFPLSGAFAAQVFAALRTADEAPVTADPADGYEYLYEWISLLERYVRDLREKLSTIDPTSPR